MLSFTFRSSREFSFNDILCTFTFCQVHCAPQLWCRSLRNGGNGKLFHIFHSSNSPPQIHILIALHDIFSLSRDEGENAKLFSVEEKYLHNSFKGAEKGSRELYELLAFYIPSSWIWLCCCSFPHQLVIRREWERTGNTRKQSHTENSKFMFESLNDLMWAGEYLINGVSFNVNTFIIFLHSQSMSMKMCRLH